MSILSAYYTTLGLRDKHMMVIAMKQIELNKIHVMSRNEMFGILNTIMLIV